MTAALPEAGRSGARGTAGRNGHTGSPWAVFADRREAGRRLGRFVRSRLCTGTPGELRSTLVVALPDGGLPVADEVARALAVPLDVLAVRRLAVPGSPGIAMGAVAEPQAVSLDEQVVRAARLTPRQVGEAVEGERAELGRRARRYRAVRPAQPVRGRQVVVVDDGMATGGTAVAACRALAAQGAGRIVLAVPVAPLESVQRLQRWADAVLALRTPWGFTTLDTWFADFAEVGEDEVLRLLAAAADQRVESPPVTESPRPHRSSGTELVGVSGGDVTLYGRLVRPATSRGLVVLAEATVGDRERAEGRRLAEQLEAAGVATLRLDLLTVVERPWQRNVRDVELLTRRLAAATRAVRDSFAWVAYVGTRTTAAAVLGAAAAPGAGVTAAVVLGATPAEGPGCEPGTVPEAPVLMVPEPAEAGGDPAAEASAARVSEWLVSQAGAVLQARGTGDEESRR